MQFSSENLQHLIYDTGKLLSIYSQYQMLEIMSA